MASSTGGYTHVCNSGHCSEGGDEGDGGAAALTEAADSPVWVAAEVAPSKQLQNCVRCTCIDMRTCEPSNREKAKELRTTIQLTGVNVT